MSESGKIFVGNLSYDVTSDDLRQLFGDIGSISDAIVINDRETGRSRGFGFVTYEDDGAADKAIKEMNDYSYEGRNLKVNRANSRSGGGGGGGGFRSGGGGGFRSGGGGGYGGDIFILVYHVY